MDPSGAREPAVCSQVDRSDGATGVVSHHQQLATRVDGTVTGAVVAGRDRIDRAESAVRLRDLVGDDRPRGTLRDGVDHRTSGVDGQR
jgi:hypothetical protein